MTSRLQDKVAIVTASSEGIGYAIAERLLSEGAFVVISSRKQTFGKIDILISNAAVNPETGGILEVSEKAIDKIIDINIKCAIMLVREAIPFMKEDSKGSIVFISSIVAYQPSTMLGMYSVSKNALLGVTKALALELVSKNIRVNCVAPGTVRTKFAQFLTSSKQVEKKLQGNIPMQRFGYASEIAAAVSFLASDDASYITGETIAVAGGQHSHL
eukprot:TRINITY_DN26334_c0_g2_i2.p3 TRINITY_DN26334_c0_g2~~TRINITY_DN26334_c0_g2_i2.p3  ORF type:complete len:215 (+),score=38.46 TRINITY_DN26334_c0_g2_i2:66-710(+)